MARGLNLCASLGLFCALSACILGIFAEISQISHKQKVPRVIRLTYIETTNFGTALAASGVDTSSLYGSGARNGDGTGLRQYYEWGLWSRCEASALGSTSNDFCDSTNWGYRFQPASTILADAPSALRTNILDALPNGVFTNDSYLGRFSHAAFYLIFIGVLLAGVAFFTGFAAHRFFFLMSAMAAFFGFLCLGVGTAIWTAIIVRARHSVNNATLGSSPLGIHVSYGNGMWILWAATLASLLSIVPFLLACCFGRSNRNDDQWDEKY